MKAELEPSTFMAYWWATGFVVVRDMASPRGKAFLACLTTDIRV